MLQAMRLAVDTGGTFTDLVVENEDGTLEVYKSPTTPDDPVRGVIDVVSLAASERHTTVSDLLASVRLFIYGTTHAINAVLTGRTARTALLVTEGHRDLLLIREGGRDDPFNTTRAFPRPYVPRSLTFAVPERIDAQGAVVRPLDEARVVEICGELKAKGVEAVAVCLLWSVLNDHHERRVAELLDEHLPGIPYTLSSALNPIVREYRRASSSAIDASLKPLMVSHLGGLESRLEDAGFTGRLLVISSTGGVVDAAEIANAPIRCLNSGPAMAPVAGRLYAERDEGASTAIVADTGGTSYDVSLVRNGRIPRSTETWLGEVWYGHMTGFPSVDVTSIGAGGGSIASIDSGGLLTVGPSSAGSFPGPVCYGRGGTRPTLTDACAALGYLDPDYFAGGRHALDIEGAREAIRRDVAAPLGVDIDTAANAIVAVATQNMVEAIEGITIDRGVDPRGTVLVGGGGAAGFNSVLIARRLSCSKLLVPETGAALSAAGALLSDLTAEFAAAVITSTSEFDFDVVNATLRSLRERGEVFAQGAGQGAFDVRFEYSVDARYENQVWDIEVALKGDTFSDAAAVSEFEQAFHLAHREVFAVDDPSSPVKITRIVLRVACTLRDAPPKVAGPARQRDVGTREAYFPETGRVETPVFDVGTLRADEVIGGPAIIESPWTTVVVNPGAMARRTPAGGISIIPAPVGSQPGAESGAGR